PPPRERVLRALFGRLLFRGRAVQPAGERRRRQFGLGLTTLVYGLFGILPARGAFALQPLAFASALHAMTFLFASLTLAAGVGRVLDADALQHTDLAHGWPLLLPPVWFGALDMLLCGVGPAASLLVPAAFGVGATLLVGWLAFAKLGAAYGVGLMALQESAPA